VKYIYVNYIPIDIVEDVFQYEDYSDDPFMGKRGTWIYGDFTSSNFATGTFRSMWTELQGRRICDSGNITWSARKVTEPPTPTPTPPSIQSKIDAANSGDTIIIKDGIYNENIKVNKRLTIRSENGADSTIIHATNSHIFHITADHVSIIGFTIEEASNKCGILISGVNSCNISNNIVSGNYQGIFLSNSSQNTIFNNNVLANKNSGIILTEGSSYNQIIKNNASNSLNGNGIQLVTSSDNNIIANNTAKNNGNNGIYLKESNNNKIANNTCSNNDYDGIRLRSNSTNNILTNNIANSNSEAGILCWTSSENILTNNNLCSNDRGIWLYNYSTDNIVDNNTATSNSYLNSFDFPPYILKSTSVASFNKSWNPIFSSVSMFFRVTLRYQVFT
jgi:parallel beta-helix repeat protein